MLNRPSFHPTFSAVLVLVSLSECAFVSLSLFFFFWGGGLHCVGVCWSCVCRTNATTIIVFQISVMQTVTEPMISPSRWCRFSFLRGALLAFCALNAILAFLFAWMMDSTELVAFRIPAVEGEWDLRVKAMACRRAGLYFSCSLVLLMLAPLLDLLRGVCRLMVCRLHFHARRRCRRSVLRDRRRFLGHKDSDPEVEELLEY